MTAKVAVLALGPLRWGKTKEGKAMKLEALKIIDLTPDPNNARVHDKKNLAAIAESLNKFGQRKPIVITKDNLIVAGNGTVEAAKQIGWTDITAVRVPDDWSADQIKAFALADNRTAELASWDQEILNQQLEELGDSGWQITDLGFEYVKPDDLDQIEEVPLPDTAPSRTKPGQVWKLGDHRVYIGDSTKREGYEKLLAGEQVDMILTDPPYNVDYHGGTEEQMTISNDNMSVDDFALFLRHAYSQMAYAAKPGAPIYVFHADGHESGASFRTELTGAGFELKQTLVWVKDRFVMGRQDYHWQHEPILYGWMGGGAHKWYGARNKATVIDDQADISKLSKKELLEIVRDAADQTTILREDKTKKNDLHPTMKPINLLAKMISYSSKRGDLILDPFAGSGSTLIAAEQLNRRAAVMEMDPKYADRLILRWEQHTGQKAVLDG
jgi:DNA modification methylase